MKINKLFCLALIVFLMGSFTIPALSQHTPIKVLNFLEETWNLKEDKLRDLLIQELHQFVAAFPDTTLSGDACYLLAKVYNEKGKKPEALASLYKGLYLYPDFSRRQESIALAQAMIAKEKDYQKKQEKLLNVLSGPILKATRADRYFAYLTFLMEFNEKDLNEWTRDEAGSFITEYPNDGHMYSVLQWIADLYAQADKNYEAANGYKKLQVLYPDNANLPYAIYNQAKLMYEKLDQNKEAVEVCRTLFLNYPQNEYAAPALFMFAEIKTKKLKDHMGAVDAYRKLLDAYPNDKMAVDALMAIGDLNKDKLDNPTNAIAVYDEFITKFRSSPRGVEALVNAGDIYKDKLKDYSRAAEYYAKISEVYPTYEKAPDMLIKAGELCEDKLKDYAKAVSYYQMILNKFGESKKADDARKKIEKAKSKM